MYHYPCEIFSANGLSPFYFQMLEVQRRHMEQMQRITTMVKSVSDSFDADRRMAGVAKFKAVCDFFNAAEKVAPEYQPIAIMMCLNESMRQKNKWI